MSAPPHLAGELAIRDPGVRLAGFLAGRISANQKPMVGTVRLRNRRNASRRDRCARISDASSVSHVGGPGQRHIAIGGVHDSDA